MLSTTSMSWFKWNIQSVFVLILMTTLTACGGGGGGGGDAPAAGGNSSAQPAGGSGGSSSALTALVITTQPQSQTVNDGDAATFSVVASGATSLAYQWKKNGVAIPGATTATLSLMAAALGDNGAEIVVTVSDVNGSITSDTTTLHVLAVAPTILNEPIPQSVLEGATATFNVSVTGSAPLAFAWRRNGVQINGATNSTYTTGALTLADTGAIFDVVVNNSQGNVTSTAATLTVTTTASAPQLTKQPLNALVPAGGSVAFSVTASGTGPLFYQWQRDGTDIPGENQPSLLLPIVTSALNNNNFRVVVSNVAGSVISSSAHLSVNSQAGQVDLVSGLYGGEGNSNGNGGSAHFRLPKDVAVDNVGNIYVADLGNGLVRKISASGITTTVAGSPSFDYSAGTGNFFYLDGQGELASFTAISSIAVDNISGNIFVIDGGTAIRKITPAGTVTTLAGVFGTSGFANGTGSNARFRTYGSPAFGQLAISPIGDIYVGDCGNNVIRKITPAGVVSTFAGIPNQSGSDNGPVASAKFSCPAGLTFSVAGDLYVSDKGNSAIRKISGGVVSTEIGGSAHADDLVIDSAGNIFYFDDLQYLKKTPAGGGVPVVMAGKCCVPGGDGVGTSAYFSFPSGMAIDGSDNIYTTEYSTSSLRKITPSMVTTTIPSALGSFGFAGYLNGSASSALFNNPIDVVSDVSGNIYVSDSSNCSIRKIDTANNVSTFAGSTSNNGGCTPATVIGTPYGIALDSAGYVYTSGLDATIIKTSPAGVPTILAGTPGDHYWADGVGSAARFTDPNGVAADNLGNLYVADSGSNAIRKIVIATGLVSTLAGNPNVSAGSADGSGLAARFDYPNSIVMSPTGDIYVADTGNQLIRKITTAGIVTTYAGKSGERGYVDGDKNEALFSSPIDVATDAAGNVYVVDAGNLLIRKIDVNGSVTTVAGIKGIKGQAFGSLPKSLNNPIAIHARTLPNNSVELLVTINHGVIRIALP